MPHLNPQQAAYGQPNPSMVNGRLAALTGNPQAYADKIEQALKELERVAADTPEQHYDDLPRPHPVLDVLDHLFGMVIRSAQGPDAFDILIVDQISKLLFSGSAQDLVIESLVHVLENICRIGGRTAGRVAFVIAHEQGSHLLRVPVATSLIKAEMVEWRRIDAETKKAVTEREEGSLEFLSSLVDAVLLNSHPIALYADLVGSLEAAWKWYRWILVLQDFISHRSCGVRGRGNMSGAAQAGSNTWWACEFVVDRHLLLVETAHIRLELVGVWNRPRPAAQSWINIWLIWSGHSVVTTMFKLLLHHLFNFRHSTLFGFLLDLTAS